jgi:RNA recognition motif-containing protein
MSASPRQWPADEPKIAVQKMKDSPRDERRGRSRSPVERSRAPRSPVDRDRRERDEGVPGACIYIAKLSKHTRERDIKEAFSQYGNIKSLIMKSSYAFMTYEAPESATEAIAKMNGAKFINGEEIVVEQSGTK